MAHHLSTTNSEIPSARQLGTCAPFEAQVCVVNEETLDALMCLSNKAQGPIDLFQQVLSYPP